MGRWPGQARRQAQIRDCWSQVAGGGPDIKNDLGMMVDSAGRQAGIHEALGELATSHAVEYDRDLNTPHSTTNLLVSFWQGQGPERLVRSIRASLCRKRHAVSPSFW